MQIDRRVIESNLPKKGFKEVSSHHKYFQHEYNGKITGAYAYTSLGSHYKSYGDILISMMKKHLRLDTNKQVRDLLQCPMSGDDYNEILRSKDLLK